MARRQEGGAELMKVLCLSSTRQSSRSFFPSFFLFFFFFSSSSWLVFVLLECSSWMSRQKGTFYVFSFFNKAAIKHLEVIIRNGAVSGEQPIRAMGAGGLVPGSGSGSVLELKVSSS